MHAIARPVGRAGWIALAASVALHAVALFGVPRFDLAGTPPSAAVAPIEARIVTAMAEPAVAPPAVVPPRVAPPQPAKAPAPRPAPVARDGGERAPIPDPLPDWRVISRTPSEEPAVAPTVVADAPSAGVPVPAEPPAAAPPAAASPAAPPPAAPLRVAPGSPLANVSYPIRSARIVYDLSWGVNPLRIGQVRHTFEVEGERYRAETVAEASGLFAALYGGQYVQRSQGHLGPDGLVPDEYFVMRGRPERAERATFDWSSRRVSFTRRDERRTVDITPGMQDPVSMLHQLYFFQPLPEVAFLDIATSRKVGTYEYERLGTVLLETPLGIFETVHLVRVDEDADRLELWLDPARGYLPLKLYFRDRKGTVFEQVARSLEVVPADTATGPPARAISRP